MILYGIVGPALEVLREIRPLVAQVFMQNEQNPLLIFAPLLLVYVGVQMIMPPLPALLPDAPFHSNPPTRHVLGDDRPLLGPVLGHQLDQELVLLLGPGFFAPCLRINLHLEASSL